MNDTGHLVQALVDIWADLPLLIGKSWETLEAALLIRLRALEVAPPGKREDEFDALLALFDPYPKARERLLEAYSRYAPHLDRGGTRSRATRRAPAIAGAIKHTRYLEIPVFYATDREPAADVKVDPFYTGDRGPAKSPLSLGVVRVSVPDDHRTGEVEKPKWWKLQFRQDPEHFVLVLGVEPLERKLFVTRARETLARGSVPEALVFIHGYNVSFADAARRAAQVIYDLHFEGLPMLYSWASEGVVLRYPVDKENAGWSLPRFRDFLTLALTELGAQRVHAIAHSMGNEVLVKSLAEFDDQKLPAGSAKLHQVILAAPDVDAGQFRDKALLFCKRAQRCTLYASSKDKALILSQELQKYPRAGQSGEGLVIVDGVDTIDATELDTGFMSHSYIGDHSSILSDVYSLIRHDAAPGERFGLSEVVLEAGRYWMFAPKGK